MVIGFKKQFVEPILQGTKVHTIREDEKGRWKAGVQMDMYTGSRFSKTEYRKFSEKTCQSTQRVFMTYFECQLEITVGTKELFGFAERERFAIADGFKNLKAFENYWIPILKKTSQGEYTGKCIHWTSLRY